MTQKPALRRTVSTLLLLAVATLVSLAGAELALRLFRPQPLGFSYRTPEGLQLHVPGRDAIYRNYDVEARVRINSMGFRGGEFAIPKPPGTFRILAVGDSFTEAMQVEEDETFVDRLARSLASEARPVEVLNLGVSGFGTSDELSLLRIYGPRLEPDLVIVFFCLANDLRNNLEGGRCRWTDAGVVCSDPERPSRGRLTFLHLKARLGTHSHLYQLLRAAATPAAFERFGLREKPPRPVDGATGIDLYRRAAAPYMTEGYALTQEILRQIRELNEKLGAETWLVAIPVREQIWEHEWQALDQSEPGALSRDHPQRALAAAARAAGIRMIDLYEPFRARHAQGDPLYNTIDTHWDASGHAVVADVLLAELRATALGKAVAEAPEH